MRLCPSLCQQNQRLGYLRVVEEFEEAEYTLLHSGVLVGFMINRAADRANGFSLLPGNEEFGDPAFEEHAFFRINGRISFR